MVIVERFVLSCLFLNESLMGETPKTALVRFFLFFLPNYCFFYHWITEVFLPSWCAFPLLVSIPLTPTT